MASKFNLSKKIEINFKLQPLEYEKPYIRVKDVKEFIKILRKELGWQTGGVGTFCCETIDKLAGETINGK